MVKNVYMLFFLFRMSELCHFKSNTYNAVCHNSWCISISRLKGAPMLVIILKLYLQNMLLTSKQWNIYCLMTT